MMTTLCILASSNIVAGPADDLRPVPLDDDQDPHHSFLVHDGIAST